MRPDSVKIDSVLIRFIPGMGQIKGSVDTMSVLHQKQLLWSDAKYIGDLIWMLPGFFYRDLGEAGKWGQLNAFGLDGRDIGISLDGRPMNDPVNGTYNIYDLPLEFIDHAEILSGSEAIVPSGQAGTAMNFVSRSYNSFRPMTKIRFVQEPKGTIITDGMFTQNVARGMNLMIGFQREVTMGRYTNADLDAWNVRTRLRYNISNRLNVSLTDFYTKTGNGLNEGVDRLQSLSLFDETSAVVVNPSSRDNRSRRDVTLSAIGRLLTDSSSTTQASLYYSTIEREFWNSASGIDDSTIASYRGVRLQQQISLHKLSLMLAGQWERRRTDSTRTLPSVFETEQSLSAQADLRLTDFFVPSISVKFISLDSENSISTGFGVHSKVAKLLTLFATMSWYDRFPTIQERYWNDSTFLRPTYRIKKEQHTFLQGGFILKKGESFQMNLTAFQRTVKDAIWFSPTTTSTGWTAMTMTNVPDVAALGLNGSILWRWHNIEAFGVMTLTRTQQADTLKTLIPDVIFAGEISYHDWIFSDKLDAKLGVRSRFFNRHQGMAFDPQTISYFENKADLIGRSTTIDLFAIVKIGDAHVSISWENILNAQYLQSPIYPMPGRQVRFGFHWVFVD